MKRRKTAIALVLLLLTGCSASETEAGPSTTAEDEPMTRLLTQVSSAVSMYAQRAVTERPDFVRNRTADNFVTCVVEAANGVARSLYLNRVSAQPTTDDSTQVTMPADLIVNEVISVVQSQIEPLMAQCA